MKKLTVKGIIGKTHGVNKANKPPINPKRKILNKELPDLSLLGRQLTKSKPRGVKYPHAVKEMTNEEFVEFGNDYLTTTKRYRTDKPHFIDKMPNNFAHIGFLKLILPNAKVINATRHPLDSCISSYKQLFYKEIRVLRI